MGAIVVCVAPLGLLGAAPSWAAASTACSGPGWNPYAASVATLQGCGIVTYPLTGTTALPDGGTGYDYASANGIRQRILVPPASFDPLTANSAQRDQYGMPQPPPTPDIAAYSAWHDEMARAHPTQPPAYLVGVPATGQTTPLNYHPWSGYLDYNPPTGPLYASAEYFTMPVDEGSRGCSAPNGAGAFFWTGIGGYGVGQLLQAGYSIGAVKGFAEGQAWSEALPDQSLFSIGWPLSAQANSHQQDAVYVSVAYHWQPSDPDYGNARFFWQDLTSGQYLPGQYLGASNDYNGSTAEWIAEQPGGSYGGYGLEHFSTFLVSDGQAFTSRAGPTTSATFPTTSSRWWTPQAETRSHRRRASVSTTARTARSRNRATNRYVSSIRNAQENLRDG